MFVSLIRFIFYVFIAYIIMKMVRVFIDPVTESKAPVKNPSPSPAKPEKKPENHTRLGDYVDFEEIK
jgi:hypothetical protein